MASGNAKYWWAVLYPDSCVDNWQENISSLCEVAGAYCIHDKDKDGHDGDRKTHIHLILAFPNTTTYNHALSVFNEVQPNCAIIKRIINIRRAYDYLIHDTDDCKKIGKYLYDQSERITFNNFDIGSYEQIGIEEKHLMVKQLITFIIDNGFTNMIDFVTNMDSCFDDRYWEVVYGYHGLFESFCRGNYLKNK